MYEFLHAWGCTVAVAAGGSTTGSTFLPSTASCRVARSAQALSTNPKCLVLDEPTSALDEDSNHLGRVNAKGSRALSKNILE